MDIHVHFPDPPKTAAILRAFNKAKDEIMAALDELTREVAETKTAQASAIALLNGLSAKLKAALTDPAKLAALAKELDDSQAALAAAVTANTPADDAPAPSPAPAPAPSPAPAPAITPVAKT